MPLQAQTLIDVLAYRAAHTAERVAYTYQNEACTYAELWQRIQQFASHLHRLGLERHGRVLMPLPNGHDFFYAFYGAQLAGGIAVPIFPGFGAARVLAMAALCQAQVVVLPTAVSPAQLQQFRQQTDPLGLTLTTFAESAGAEQPAAFPPLQPDDIAFLQYTSGSTGDPKGVQLSHRNLLTNINQMIAGMAITAEEIFVSWLPVYHDMGLILKTMVPFYLAAQTHLLPSSLSDVRPWFAAIAAHKATFTAAPDFAYRLALRRIADPRVYDLSSLRVALNAAEPVRADTIRRFEQAFGLERVMVAGYGLAEATVGVSMWPPHTAVRVDERGFVSVGRPFPQVHITIVQDDQPLPPNTIGEIGITSPANTRGYFQNPSGTQRLFLPLAPPVSLSNEPPPALADNLFWQAYFAWRQAHPLEASHEAVPTIASGDLGYLDEDGFLYIVGRKKNTIIQAGQTLYAAEVEEVANGVAGVRYTAVVGLDDGGLQGERVAIFAEIRPKETTTSHSDTDAYQDIIIEIVQQFQDRFGFRPGAVYLLPPKAIPMTYNGKLKHQALQQQFEQGTLPILYPEQ